jgi:DNA-binding SARP family transcriptional activator
VEFRILGPLEVLHAGETVPLRGSRERTLLIRLLLSPNRVVPLEGLAEDLCHDVPSDGAAQALWVYASRLRKALREHGGGEALVTQPPGYLLRVGPEDLDAARFEAGVGRARQLAAAGDHGGAAATLRESLALWRGPALADVADAPFARAEAARLAEARLAAIEERIEADLACGRHTELTAELDSLTRAHPLRERLWAQRMLALYRAGRQAEALRAYQELRRLLAHELGLEPDEALRRLEAGILRHDPELDGPPPAPTPSSLAPGGLATMAPVPMPALLTEIGRIFVGREQELERLSQLWKEAQAGELRLALVTGEPGVGKTRLAAELARRVHAEGAMVLAGRCDEDLGVPYQPFVEALRIFVHHLPEGELSERLGRHRGELARLVPELAERVPDLPPPLQSDPETERYRLFDAVADWLATTSADQPVLLVLDDLQWAAKPTLLLLRHVVRSPELRRLLVVSIYRDTELSHDHPMVELLADLRRQGGVERLSLSGLDQAGVVAFMEQAAGHDLDDEDLLLARAIYEETEGNPFFVREVLRHLTETGAVDRREGRWATRLPVEELGIPEGVREVVGRRLSRLSEEANRVLRVAAVVGPEFELPVIQEAAGLDEEDLLSALEEANEARLVIEVRSPAPRYRFTHALVRDTLYGELSAARRVTLHRRVGEAIEAVHAGRLDDHLPALAHHYARASAGDTARAVDYAARAGDRALAQLAHDEAVAYYGQALELLDVTEGPPDEALRLELLISLGDAQCRAGNPAHRETLLEAGRLADQQGDAERAARAALANQRGLFSRIGGSDPERVAALEQALDAVSPAPTPLRARLLAQLSVELQFAQDERRLDLAREALAIARAADDPATLAPVLAAAWLAHWNPALAAEQSQLVDELAEVATRQSDRSLEFQAGFARFITASQQGDMARVDSGLNTCVRIADELGQPVLSWRATHLRAHRAWAGGRLQEAERLLEETGRLAEALGQPDLVVWSHSPLSVLRLLQGRPEEAAALIGVVIERLPGVLAYQAILAWAHAEAGREEEARTILAHIGAEGFTKARDYLTRDYLWLVGSASLARACARLGDVEAAEELHSLLLPHRDQMVIAQTVWLGPVAHDLGLLASTLERYDEADSHFAHAADAQERIGAQAGLVHTQLEWARMLRRRARLEDTVRARTLLEAALAGAREVGATGLVPRIDALLA